ncbi:MAG: hypothetical protein WA061_02775 [Microgenomates group bacterium]
MNLYEQVFHKSALKMKEVKPTAESMYRPEYKIKNGRLVSVVLKSRKPINGTRYGGYIGVRDPRFSYYEKAYRLSRKER